MIPVIPFISYNEYCLLSYMTIACFIFSLSTLGLPPIRPLALALFIPSFVLRRIMSRSNCATPAMSVNINCPAGVEVSIHGSFKLLMHAPAFPILSTISKRSFVDRLNLVSSETTTTSSFPSMSSIVCKTGRSILPPPIFSVTILSHPSSVNWSICLSRFCSSVLTRA